MNKIILSGNVGQDPILRGDNTKVISFSIATSDYFGGEKRTNWHTCKAFGKLAETINSYVNKGDKILVEGMMTYPSWTKDGETRHGTEVLVNNIEFLTKAEKTESKEAPF